MNERFRLKPHSQHIHFVMKYLTVIFLGLQESELGYEVWLSVIQNKYHNGTNHEVT